MISNLMHIIIIALSLQVLSAGQRICFFAFCSFLGGVLFLIGDVANKMIWGGKTNKKKN